MTSNQKKILLIENFPADFFKARLPLAKFLKYRGWDVYAMVPGDSAYSAMIQDEGINVIEYQFDRNDKGISQIFSLNKIYRKVIQENAFDIVHSFRFQPNLLNVIAGIGLKHKKILHITGLGIAFSNTSIRYIILRLISQFIFLIKLIFAEKVIMQNPDDITDIWTARLFKKKIRLIEGSGIDINKFDPKKFNKAEIRAKRNIDPHHFLFICITRLIWEKGISELVDAFKQVHTKHPNLFLYIVGWPDYDNPRHVTDEFISSIDVGTGISFLGNREDIPELLAMSDIFIFPSYYREGVPRGILEAMAMGLPIITTDTPGCKLTVEESVNGILITPKSVGAIVDAIEKILQTNILQLGAESRLLAEQKFQENLIFTQIESLYS